MTDTMRKTYKVLAADEQQMISVIKQAGEEFCDHLEDLGQRREFSIAKTKMEEAVMWAVKGITA